MSHEIFRRLGQAQDDSEAIEIIFSTVEDLIERRQWPVINDILRYVPLDFNNAKLFAFLSLTLNCPQDALPYRPAFYAFVLDVVRKRDGWAKATKLLSKVKQPGLHSKEFVSKIGEPS